MSTDDAPKVSGTRFSVVAVVVAAIGGFLFGYDTGVISGALLFIKKDLGDLTSFEQDAAVSGLLLGAAIGAVIAGRVADRVGRKPTIIGTAALFVVGIVIIIVAQGLEVLVAGRFVVGLAVGASSVIVPAYLAEIAAPEHRGAVVTANQVMITTGIVVAYLVDYAFSSNEDWRAMFAVAIIPAAILGVGMIFLPESPRYLLARGRRDDARDVVLRMVADPDRVEGELDKMDQGEFGRPRWSALLAPNLRKVLVIGVVLAVAQQVTGINTVIYFAPTILSQTGLGSGSSILNSLPIGVVNLLVTIIAVFLVDRVGRRTLLLISLAGMSVTLVGLGLAFQTTGDTKSALALTFLILYVASFAIGLGPVFWLLISEIYPGEIRGEAMSVATAANWLANFVVALSFLSLLDAFGQTATFFGFGVLSVFSILFTLKFVPETKDRSLEEIAADLGTTSDELAAAAT